MMISRGRVTVAVISGQRQVTAAENSVRKQRQVTAAGISVGNQRQRAGSDRVQQLVMR
jgi:hypothetical protein